MADDALAQLEEALDLVGGGGWQLQTAQDVDAVAMSADGVRQAFAAPCFNAFDASAALRGQGLYAGIDRLDGGIIQVRVEDDHQFVQSHSDLLSMAIKPSLDDEGRKGREEYTV